MSSTYDLVFEEIDARHRRIAFSRQPNAGSTEAATAIDNPCRPTDRGEICEMLIRQDHRRVVTSAAVGAETEVSGEVPTASPNQIIVERCISIVASNTLALLRRRTNRRVRCGGRTL